MTPPFRREVKSDSSVLTEYGESVKISSDYYLMQTWTGFLLFRRIKSGRVLLLIF